MMVRSVGLIGAVALFGTAVAMAQTTPSTASGPIGKTPPSVDAKQSAPAADGAATQAMFEKTCSGCHDLSQATSQSNDRAGWKAVIETMVGYGAQIAPPDQDRLAAYLVATHGPTVTPKS